MERGLFIGGAGPGHSESQHLLLRYANRHGLIAGATGTGKTVTLQVLAEQFSAQGVPVFLSDVKGDLTGLGQAGNINATSRDDFAFRAEKIGLADYNCRAFPVVLWDIFGEDGHPMRTTLERMGPLLVSRLLELTEAQDGVLNIAFKLAREQGHPLRSLDDLRLRMAWLGEHREEIGMRYGNVSASSVGAILRRLLVLEEQGADAFFSAGLLDIADLLLCNEEGFGNVNILAAHKLVRTPQLYAMSLLWLLSELYAQLPEIGDPKKPRIVFFFDEAHLLFNDTPKALMSEVEQIARLIRSKGVGIYFVTQNPTDIPENILGQIGNRIQHALRAFTARDRRALRLAAETYRDNRDLDIKRCIQEIGIGEAITSFLESEGVPGIAQRTLVRPPSSHIGPLGPESLQAILDNSPLKAKYDQLQDLLNRRASGVRFSKTTAVLTKVDDPVQTNFWPTRSPSQHAEYSAHACGLRAGRAVTRIVLSRILT